MKTFYISTFGCRANQADSAVLREDLHRHALDEVDSHLEADVVVINSCTVTHNSDRQVRQLVRKIHRENPRAQIVLTGCYAERKPEELVPLEGVRFIVGNAKKTSLADIILNDDLENDGTYCGNVRIHHGDITEEKELRLAPAMDIGEKTRPFLKIQDGCDARCSYCIIPFVRGPGRSAPPDEIVCQINAMVAAGYKEVVLTGIHIGTYGWKLPFQTTLAALIRKILDETALPRLRIGSIEPMRFSTELIDLAADCSRIAPHFHLPLQSGCDRILRRMRRPYTVARYARIIDTIRRKIPQASIGADVIVGFPGETESEHRQTYDFIKNSPLTYLHVFTYSPRAGTPAAVLPDPVDGRHLAQRSQELRRLSLDKNLAFRRSSLGQMLSVLTLRETDGDAERLTALSDNYIKVKLPRVGIPANEIIDVRVLDVQEDSVFAELVC